jgi:hypothetical protein
MKKDELRYNRAHKTITGKMLHGKILAGAKKKFMGNRNYHHRRAIVKHHSAEGRVLIQIRNRNHNQSSPD